MFNNIFSKSNCILVSDFNDFKLKNKVSFNKKEEFSSKLFLDEILDRNSINDFTKINFTRYQNIYRNVDKSLFEFSKINCDLFVLKPGFIGREFSKSPSFNYIDSSNYNSFLFEVISGQGFVLLEEIGDNTNIKLIKVKKGSKVFVEKGFGVVLINNSSNNLVLISLYSKDLDFNFNLFKNNFGTSIFLTRIGFIKNKNILPLYNLEEFENDYLPDLQFKKEKSIYQEFIGLPEKFNFLKN